MALAPCTHRPAPRPQRQQQARPPPPSTAGKRPRPPPEDHTGTGGRCPHAPSPRPPPPAPSRLRRDAPTPRAKRQVHQQGQRRYALTPDRGKPPRAAISPGPPSPALAVAPLPEKIHSAIKRNERYAPAPQKTGDPHRASHAPPRRGAAVPTTRAQRPPTASTTKSKPRRPNTGSRPRPAPQRPGTATPTTITALCAPHSARKPALSWGRVVVSSPFQKVRPNTHSVSIWSYFSTLQYNNHPNRKKYK
jgi:hypothetical protein